MKSRLPTLSRLETSIVVLTMLVFAVLLVWQNLGSETEQPALQMKSQTQPADLAYETDIRARRHRQPSVVDSSRTKGGRATRLERAPRLPNRAELEQRAASAEQEANHELDRLVGLLDLSERQQDQVFSFLVEKSPHFDPRFEIRGGATLPPGLTGDSYESGLAALLDERQATRYVDEEGNRRAWWTEIVESLIPEEELPQIMPPPIVSPPAPNAPSTPPSPVPAADQPPTKAVTRPTRLPIE